MDIKITRKTQHSDKFVKYYRIEFGFVHAVCQHVYIKVKLPYASFIDFKKPTLIHTKINTYYKRSYAACVYFCYRKVAMMRLFSIRANSDCKKNIMNDIVDTKYIISEGKKMFYRWRSLV